MFVVDWSLAPDEDFDPESLKTKFVFWIGNLLFVLVTLLPIPILFSSVKANTFYILFVLMAAVYNGSNYYFEVFAARYMQQFEEKQQAIRALNEKEQVTDDSLIGSNGNSIAGEGNEKEVVIKEE